MRIKDTLKGNIYKLTVDHDEWDGITFYVTNKTDNYDMITILNILHKKRFLLLRGR